MIFKELQSLMIKYGLKLTYIQTGNELDILTYENSTTEDFAHVQFEDDLELPDDIKNGRKFEYDEGKEPWLLNLPIQSISFYVDIDFSYQSENVIYTNNPEKVIILSGKDLDLTEKVLNLVTNPLSRVHLIEEYAIKMQEFYYSLNKYLPILLKHGFNQNSIYTSDINSILKDLFVSFYQDERFTITFILKAFSWRSYVVIELLDKPVVLSLEVKEDIFEKELINQLAFYEN